MVAPKNTTPCAAPNQATGGFPRPKGQTPCKLPAVPHNNLAKPILEPKAGLSQSDDEPAASSTKRAHGAAGPSRPPFKPGRRVRYKSQQTQDLAESEWVCTACITTLPAVTIS